MEELTSDAQSDGSISGSATPASSPIPASPAAVPQVDQVPTATPESLAGVDNPNRPQFNLSSTQTVPLPGTAPAPVGRAPLPPGSGPLPRPTGPGPVPPSYNDFAAQAQDLFEVLAVNGPAAAQRLAQWIKNERSIAYSHGKHFP